MTRIRHGQVVTSCRATNTADVHVPCAVHPAVLSTYFPIFSKAELLKPRQIGVSLQSPLLALEMRMARTTTLIQRGTELLWKKQQGGQLTAPKPARSSDTARETPNKMLLVNRATLYITQTFSFCFCEINNAALNLPLALSVSVCLL